MKPRITNEGLSAQIRGLDPTGPGITFTGIKMGNGDLSGNYMEFEDLINPLVTLELTEYSLEESYVKLKANFNNSRLQAGFRWKEVGIFIQDPDDENEELLYAYGHCDLEEETEIAANIPKNGDEIYEIQLTYRVYIGSAENITAIVAESSTYATKEELDEHADDSNNPHHVTAEQVGLGNVENKATNDLTPTGEEAEDLENLEDGDKVSIIIGKIKKAISNLISHINDTAVHVSSNERTAWNNKANQTHEHSASQITSGTLGVTRGGTGGNTARSALENLGVGMKLFSFECTQQSISANANGTATKTATGYSGYQGLAFSDLRVSPNGAVAITGATVAVNSSGSVEVSVTLRNTTSSAQTVSVVGSVWLVKSGMIVSS